MSFINSFFHQFRKLLLGCGFLLSMYTIIRVAFLIYNRSLFSGLSVKDCLQVFYSGISQDIVTILLLNGVLILVIFVVSYVGSLKKVLYPVIRWCFVLINSIGLALNVLDIAYFRFSRQRTNANLTYVLSDSLSSFKSIISSYAFLIIFFCLLVIVLVRLSRFLFQPGEPSKKYSKKILLNQLILILIVGFVVRGFRGNYILPSSPLLYVEPTYLPVAQNSFYTFAYSILRKQKQVIPKHYFSQKELGELVSASHQLSSDQPAQKKNVIIFILESFSREFLEPGNSNKAYTPFFDSLIKKSISFPNAFANGFQSNQGIVSILGGLPAFLDEPFYYSAYANTPLKSIGNILKENGYSTNFFMGAGKDHFGFEKFGRTAGIDNYYTRVDFNDDHFYDGNWGIFDDPFFQFSSQILDKKTQPFFAVLFNISSHPPFTIPKELQQRFNSPQQPAEQRSISYVDYAFQHFFQTSKKSSWFQNSIFVFCADHSYLSKGSKSKSYGKVATSMIPIFIYDPSKDKGVSDTTVISQVDITPTILSYLHFTCAYNGFGINVFDSTSREHYVINKPGYIYQILTKEFVLGYDASVERCSYLYHYQEDNQLKNNLLNRKEFEGVERKMEILLKANIQCYNDALTRRSFR